MMSGSSGIGKRITGLLVGAGALVVGGVILTAGPAMADNGPHVSNQGTTAIGSSVDGCAGCHRLHASQNEDFQLTASTEEALCATCHDAGVGATTDPFNGVAYTAIGNATPVGALRGGGFNYALIGSGSATRSDILVSGRLSKTANTIPVRGSAQAVTSSHAVGSNATMWGSGAISAVANSGSTVKLECGSCHDPHGNGNYRILRTYGSLGAQTIVSPTTMQTVTAVTVTADTVNTTATTPKYIYTFTTGSAHGYVSGQPVFITGVTPSTYNTASGSAVTVATVPTTTSFTLVNQTGAGYSAGPPVVPGTDPGAITTSGTVAQAWPNTIKSAVGNGTTVTYTMYRASTLVSGQKVSITGITPTTLNATRATITVTSTTTFTVLSSVTATYVAGGYLTGIPDVAPTASKIYTITNYWRSDDHNYVVPATPQLPTSPTDGSNIVNGTSAVIANVSQWCSTCHTRYMANSGSTTRTAPSGDAVFKYRHVSGGIAEDAANCLQCHVAHGSNAQMDGTFSSSIKGPNGEAVTSGDSRLLRMDNRGICIMCHDM